MQKAFCFRAKRIGFQQRRNDEGFFWNAHVFKHTVQGQSTILLWCKVWFPFPWWKLLVHVSQNESRKNLNICQWWNIQLLTFGKPLENRLVCAERPSRRKLYEEFLCISEQLDRTRHICFIELNSFIMKHWWMAFFARYFSPSHVHIGNSVHLQRQRCKQQPKSLIFFAALLTKYNRNIMLVTTFKEKCWIGVVG